MQIKRSSANLLLNKLISPIIRPICWGRKIPEGYEQWKNVSFSWSQFGEDLLIRSALQKLECWDQKMTYVDVGAFHPVKYSNTLLLHGRGWQGINIDPNPATIQLFAFYRPKDLNLLCGIGSEQGPGHYHQPVKGQVSATSSLINPSLISSMQGKEEGCIIQVPVRRLDEILSTYKLDTRQWGLLNIDTEGTEMQVLESNCWSKFRPLVISVEENYPEESRLDPFLTDKAYKLIGECFITKIYVDSLFERDLIS